MGNCSCSCGDDSKKKKLLYSCSGAATVGELADHVVRRLRKHKIGNMTCLSAVAAKLSGFIQSAMAVSENIVIDGCAAGCGKKIFEQQNIPYTHYILTNFGIKKGKTEITTELIQSVTDKLTKEIQNG